LHSKDGFSDGPSGRGDSCLNKLREVKATRPVLRRAISWAAAALCLSALDCGSNTASQGGVSGAGTGASVGSGSAAAGGTGAGSGSLPSGSSGVLSAGSGASGSATSGVSSGGASGTLAASGSNSASGVSASGATTGSVDAGADSSLAPPDSGLAAIDGSVRGCTPTPSPNLSMARAGECDYLLQSIDFEDSYGYPSPPGSIKVTNFGLAFGAYAINSCGPYCYAKNLTINVDIVGGGDPTALQGEVIFEFPAIMDAGLPITTSAGRSSLAWIMLDGPTAPPFKITGQMVIETTTGIVSAVEVKELAYNNWLNYEQAEFKYFPITSANGFPTAPVNVTGMGFRILGPANLPAGTEWHGVAYIDHLQIRAGQPDNPPGAYPFGL
jgi:hypothetical protein